MQGMFDAMLDPCNDELVSYSACNNRPGPAPGFYPPNCQAAPEVTPVDCSRQVQAHAACISRRMERLRVVRVPLLDAALTAVQVQEHCDGLREGFDNCVAAEGSNLAPCLPLFAQFYECSKYSLGDKAADATPK